MDAAAEATDSFDFEVLSLNMINNAVLALKQFAVLSKSSSSSFVIQRPRLSALYRKLKYSLAVARTRLNHLVTPTVSDADPRDFTFVAPQSSSTQSDTMLNEYQELFFAANTTHSAKI